MIEAAMAGASEALLKLREEGVVKAVGLGVNEWQVAHEALLRQDFDCLLLAGRYTLLEQDALDGFLPLCERNQVSVILGGGYKSGILATGVVPGAEYNCASGPEAVLERVRKMEQACWEYSVPLKAAASQFVLGQPAIPTNIPGVRTVAQLEDNLRNFRADIPAEFWVELKRRELLRRDGLGQSSLSRMLFHDADDGCRAADGERAPLRPRSHTRSIRQVLRCCLFMPIFCRSSSHFATSWRGCAPSCQSTTRASER